MVVRDYQAVESFVGYVGSISLTGGETIVLDMPAEPLIEAAVEESIVSLEELGRYGSVDSLLSGDIAQVAVAAATDAIVAGEVAAAIGSGLGILGLLAAALAISLPGSDPSNRGGNGNSGGAAGTTAAPSTTTTTTTSSSSSTSACTYKPVQSWAQQVLS